jgi:4-amino-4-deoxy-L-arabinose transferase-like glycosyltransferase
VAILGVGFLPWTALLGWLWRRRHWQSLEPRARDAWLFLSVWAAFTVGFFTLSRSKLPAYILPAFPQLALLVAVRWFRVPAGETAATAPMPVWVWRVGAAVAAFVLPVAHAVGGFAAAVWLARRWAALTPAVCARWAAGFALAHWGLVTLGIHTLENDLSSNQTLKPVGLALRQGYSPGDAVAVWGRFPQGLPFHAYPAINATNRPYLGDLNTNKVPFQSVGNLARFAPYYLADDEAFQRLLHEPRRVWVVTHTGSFERMKLTAELPQARLVCTCGRVELFVSR